ncbi:hypothetical protein [Actinocatenispora rupis]|uniref:Phosphotransferase enzyme family protein n=1 Tax=Actinocatenispora rupis TaxID=519421 RepID=A0A8J3N8I1_9ACTN|nr:hypothetical protein [Actinocatenispora rupis]GID10339.1 hypothetical protein Aru02nite_12280 [Actinocatenispora rupis]
MTVPAELTAGEAARRAAYLTEVLPLLYPPPCAVSLPGTSTVDDTSREYVVLPDMRRARLLAPAGSTRVTVGAVRRYSEPQSLTSRMKRGAVVAALRTGASRVLLRDRVRVSTPDGADNIERCLRELLGVSLVPSVHIGPARANRKPVLQLLDEVGRTIAFVKLGINELTRGLVRAEARALLTVANAGFRHLSAPAVLSTGQWRGHELLASSALPIDRPRVPLTRETLVAAMREVAGVTGLRRQRLADSRYWARLRARLAGLTATEDGRALAAAGRDLVLRTGGLRLEFGAWHGDWTPWNMASTTEGLLVWDWERFDTGVPVGFDPLHYRLQAAIVRDGREPRAAVTECLDAAGPLLADAGVPAEAARVTALLYLVDLAARYLGDKQAEAGARLGVLGTWLLPELVAAVRAVDDPSPTEVS